MRLDIPPHAPYALFMSDGLRTTPPIEVAPNSLTPMPAFPVFLRTPRAHCFAMRFAFITLVRIAATPQSAYTQHPASEDTALPARRASALHRAGFQTIAQDTIKSAKQRQRARESADAMTRARRLVALGDTMAALSILRKAAENDKRNGPLLFEWGNLLAEKSRPGWRRFLMPNGISNMIIKAESAMALAMALEPDSGHYAIPYGRLLWSTNIFSVYKATGLQQGAITKLDSTSSPARFAEAADQLGIMMFRRYETMMGRTLPGVVNQAPERVTGSGLARFMTESYVVPDRMPGWPNYREAVEYFRTARSLDPDNELYFRHEMMALSDLKRWDEMVAQSRARMRERPQQPWPWLVLGVAEHRRGRFTAAKAAFDSGFARLPEDDYKRLQSLSFLSLRRKQTMFDSLGDAERSATEQLFWNTVNPSLLLPTNMIHVEFLARTVYSELRFTDDEARRNGANSNMGEIFIRYGPPDRMIGVQDGQLWAYFRENMTFKFDKFSLYGTARLSVGSWVAYDSIIIDRPVAFTNLPILRHRIDSVSTQIARFRAARDSMDVAIFAGFRPGALRRNSPLETSAIKQGVFLVDALGDVVQQSTATLTSIERDTLVVSPRSWFMRTSSNIAAVRVEALEPDLLQAARSATDVAGFTTRGFGLSDLLVVSKATATRDPDRPGHRWTDYQLAPLTASRVVRGDPITLLWETYEAPSERGSSRVQVAVTVERETGSGLVALAGRIVGGLRNAVTGSRGNAVTMSYVREFAENPVVVDMLEVQLGQLESGRYRVTLRVTDLITNNTVTRMQQFGIDRAEK